MEVYSVAGGREAGSCGRNVGVGRGRVGGWRATRGRAWQRLQLGHGYVTRRGRKAAGRTGRQVWQAYS